MMNTTHLIRALPLSALLMLLTACGVTGTESTSSNSPDVDKGTLVEQVAHECTKSRTPAKDAIYATDGGRTLIVDSHGEDDPTGVGATIDELVCVLAGLDVTDAVIAHMENTRAMDGHQSAEWGDYTASWTYHPDSGLDLIIEER